MSKSIKVKVGTDGSTSVEAEGFQGEGCDVRTGEIAQLLGTVESDEKKPEFFESEGQSAEQG